jgi:hypothetical protein
MITHFLGPRARLGLLFAASFISATPVSAVVLLRVEQVGSDVVVTGSGTANTTALSATADNEFTNVLDDGQIYAGPNAFADGSVNRWTTVNGPASFGSNPGVVENPTSGSGDLVGILAAAKGGPQLVLPSAYISGASLSGTSTFAGTSLASLGLSPGQTSTWTWGSGANADSFNLEVAADPVPVPLPVAGAAFVFHQFRRYRRLATRLRG